MYIRVRVKAGSREESFKKIKGDHFEVSVKEKAERNLANKRTMKILSEHFNIPLNKVRIVNGHHSPSKILNIDLD